MMQGAMQKLQANPEDQEARQALMQGSQITKKAREALNIAQTNLKDMFTGPKADKHTKMLEKAFGIDDKNAQTPERAAAIKAIQKAQGVDEKTAAMMSNLPQRQQLGPQASQQAQLQHAGAVGKPATGGQVLAAQGKKGDQLLKVEVQSNHDKAVQIPASRMNATTEQVVGVAAPQPTDKNPRVGAESKHASE